MGKLVTKDCELPGKGKSPIVLIHGLAGFGKLFGCEYYNGIPGHLRSIGYEVAVPVTHPTATIQHRAGQLLAFLNEHYPDRHVHLVAHSMGGLDARYLASPGGLNQGHRFISITTIATPHQGSILARFSASLRLAWPLCWICRKLRNRESWDDETRKFFQEFPDQKMPGVKQLTPEFIRNEFNPATPDHPHPVYRSYGGKNFGENGATADWMFFLQWPILSLFEGANDGLVSVASARWGQWKGILPANHRDQIGHLNPRSGIPFDRFAFYANLAHEVTSLESATVSFESRYGANVVPMPAANSGNFAEP